MHRPKGWVFPALRSNGVAIFFQSRHPSFHWPLMGPLQPGPIFPSFPPQVCANLYHRYPKKIFSPQVRISISRQCQSWRHLRGWCLCSPSCPLLCPPYRIIKFMLPPYLVWPRYQFHPQTPLQNCVSWRHLWGCPTFPASVRDHLIDPNPNYPFMHHYLLCSQYPVYPYTSSNSVIHKRLGPAKDIHFFYMLSHLSAL